MTRWRRPPDSTEGLRRSSVRMVKMRMCSPPFRLRLLMPNLAIDCHLRYILSCGDAQWDGSVKYRRARFFCRPVTQEVWHITPSAADLHGRLLAILGRKMR